MLSTLPQARHIEDEVLSGLINASHYEGGIDEALELLKPEYFCEHKDRLILEAIRNLRAGGIEVTGTTLGERLKADGKLDYIGGYRRIMALENYCAFCMQIKHLVPALEAIYLRRELRRLAMIINDKYLLDTVNPGDLVDEVKKRITDIEKLTSNEYVKTDDIISVLTARRASIAAGSMPYVATGLDDIDRMLNGGFPRRYPVVIKGFKGRGKTALLLQILAQMVEMGRKVLLMSLEMGRDDVWPRVTGGKLYRGGKVDTSFNYSCLWNTGDWIAKRPDLKRIEDYTNGWFIDDRESLSPVEVFKSISRHIRKHNVDVVAIDHLNLITHPIGHTQQDKELFAEQLRAMAKARNIVLIQVLQIQPKDKTAYYYKTAEQAAAVILSVDTTSERGEAIIEMEKNRFGPWGRRKMHFLGGVQTFERPGGGGYYVPKLDGLVKSGDNRVQGQDNRGDAAGDRAAGRGVADGPVAAPDAPEPEPVAADLEVDFFDCDEDFK